MNKKGQNIYLDNAATTPVAPEVFEAMKPYFGEVYGNPGSLHSFGREAAEAINQARKTLVDFLGCKLEELIFTAGGSASDNLAIRGIVDAVKRPETRDESQNPSRSSPVTSLLHPIARPHIITSAFEHKAVLDTVKDLEKSGLIEATYIKPTKEGLIKVEDVKSAIKENTVLVSIMYVNNEIGTIQPIRAIGQMLKKLNAERQTLNVKRQAFGVKRVYFHTDAVQAIEFCPVDPKGLGVDLMTFTAHKIYGPKGIGALYIKAGTPIKPQITGGGQEFGLSAGTENTPGIIGFAKAIQLVSQEKSSKYSNNLAELRNRMIDGILKSIPQSRLNGNRQGLSPAIANISFINAEGESILLYLDNLGIAVSTGSACTSRTLEPSHVLSAMGLRPEEAHGSIRFSLGRKTTEADIDRVLEVLPGIIKRIREMSPYK